MYALAYADGTRRFYPMAAFDISEPVAPKLLATYREFGGLKPSHIHDAYVRNHIAYLNAGYDGLVVADFTNPQAPQTLGLMQRYTGAGYNHSGWASADGQYYYMGDETHGSPVKTIQLNFDCQPEVMTTFNAESRAPSSIAHNQVVACGYLYVSYYYDGLQIFDLRDPLHPERVGYYPTSREPAGRSYKGAWGVYPLPEANLILVSDMQEGLFVLKGMGDVCSREETSPIACGAVTGIGQPPSIEWHIYPQPAFDHLLVEIPETVQQQAFQLILYNALGQKVTDFKAAPSETQLVLPLENNLLPGIYRLDIRTGSQILERKMILIGR